MKIMDVFLSIGIIILAALLIFVVYDDLSYTPYQLYIDSGMENYTSPENNLSENVSILQKYFSNNTNNPNTALTSKTEKTDTQTSINKMNTQTLDDRKDSLENSNLPKNDVNNNIKTYQRDYTPSSFSHTYNDKVIKPNEAFKTGKM